MLTSEFNFFLEDPKIVAVKDQFYATDSIKPTYHYGTFRHNELAIVYQALGLCLVSCSFYRQCVRVFVNKPQISLSPIITRYKQ